MKWFLLGQSKLGSPLDSDKQKKCCFYYLISILNSKYVFIIFLIENLKKNVSKLLRPCLTFQIPSVYRLQRGYLNLTVQDGIVLDWVTLMKVVMLIWVDLTKDWHFMVQVEQWHKCNCQFQIWGPEDMIAINLILN